MRPAGRCASSSGTWLAQTTWPSRKPTAKADRQEWQSGSWVGMTRSRTGSPPGCSRPCRTLPRPCGRPSQADYGSRSSRIPRRSSRQAGRGAAPASPDLLLYAGADADGSEGKAIVWGRKRIDRSLFVPLPREAWIGGRSHPTGMGSVQVGGVDGEQLRSLALLL